MPKHADSARRHDIHAHQPVGCLDANPTGDPGPARAILQQPDLNQSANPIEGTAGLGNISCALYRKRRNNDATNHAQTTYMTASAG
jgi:hypothetical protein